LTNWVDGTRNSFH